MNGKIRKLLSLFITAAALLSIAMPAWAGRLGPHLDRIIENDGARHAGGRLAATFKRTVKGTDISYAYVFIEGERSSIALLKALGVEINTVTSSGIMTAAVPVNKLRAVAAVSGVRRVEAAQTVKKMMDVSAGPTGVNLPDLEFPRTDNSGAGVIIGVIDTGIDIEHPDFIDDAGNTRILSIWDHTIDVSDVDQSANSPSDFTYGTEWSQEQIQGGYTTCPHVDTDGHGTHVAGTAGGDGGPYEEAGRKFIGLAPNAEFLIVKFDFDNVKNRNTETAILDGINWIFQKAEAAGKPCVINMSLGSDYGPHDGSTSEERGIDDLTGPGKIVCIAAGNAGSDWSGPSFETHGGPIHGSGTVGTDDDIVFNVIDDPEVTDGDDYIFFDVWYPGNVEVYVQITTPGGITYPQSYTGRNRDLWYTDGKAGGFSTNEGFIYVENVSGANSFWETDNGDNNIYIEISDYQGDDPAEGTWTIDIIEVNDETAVYHSWQGFSGSLRHSYFQYEGQGSDNNMTIGKPASAFSAIAVGAYQTKDFWPARDYLAEGYDCTDPESGFPTDYTVMMGYGIPPIDYYNDFFMQDLAYFSSRGPTRDGRTEPFISAPGVGIVASLSQTNLGLPGDNYFRCMNRVDADGWHATLQGTSMACPHGTGSVAVLLGEANGQGSVPTPADMKEILRLGANKDAYTELNPDDPDSSNNDWGYGKIDVSVSLENINETPDLPPSVKKCEPDTGAWSEVLDVAINGTHFQPGATVSFGSGITVTATEVVDDKTIACTIAIAWRAKKGTRDIVVTNPDNQRGVLPEAFTVVRR